MGITPRRTKVDTITTLNDYIRYIKISGGSELRAYPISQIFIYGPGSQGENIAANCIFTEVNKYVYPAGQHVPLYLGKIPFPLWSIVSGKLLENENSDCYQLSGGEEDNRGIITIDIGRPTYKIPRIIYCGRWAQQELNEGITIDLLNKRGRKIAPGFRTVGDYYQEFVFIYNILPPAPDGIVGGDWPLDPPTMPVINTWPASFYMVHPANPDNSTAPIAQVVAPVIQTSTPILSISPTTIAGKSSSNLLTYIIIIIIILLLSGGIGGWYFYKKRITAI